MRNFEVRFKRAPATPGEFEVVPAEVPRLPNGGILCRARWLAADALFAPLAEHPAVPGEIVPALGVYEVIESRNDVFTVGQCVVLECGMRELCATDGHDAIALHPGHTPASTALGVLGPDHSRSMRGDHDHPDAQAKVRILRLNPSDYRHRRAEFLKDAIAWYGAGRLVCHEDVITGLENAPAHLGRVLRGEHFGQPLIKV